MLRNPRPGVVGGGVQLLHKVPEKLPDEEVPRLVLGTGVGQRLLHLGMSTLGKQPYALRLIVPYYVHSLPTYLTRTSLPDFLYARVLLQDLARSVQLLRTGQLDPQEIGDQGRSVRMRLKKNGEVRVL